MRTWQEHAHRLHREDRELAGEAVQPRQGRGRGGGGAGGSGGSSCGATCAEHSAGSMPGSELCMSQEVAIEVTVEERGGRGGVLLVDSGGSDHLQHVAAPWSVVPRHAHMTVVRPAGHRDSRQEAGGSAEHALTLATGGARGTPPWSGQVPCPLCAELKCPNPKACTHLLGH